MQVIDIHSHLQFSDFDSTREDIVKELKRREWGTIVVGTNLQTSLEAVNLSNKHAYIWATVGQHPTELEKIDTKSLEEIAANNSLVAIGECGLDYFRSSRDEVFDVQVSNFEAQIELAIKYQLPLMLHGRPTKKTMNAYQDMIDILRGRADELPKNPGNAHFFVGDIDIAKQFLEMNFTLSFDGPITFARDYDKVIAYAPSDMIHAETDSPYAAPVPHRGQQNSPLYVDSIINTLIEVRNEPDPVAFRAQLVANAKRVFKL